MPKGLSGIDRKILTMLLESQGRVSSNQVSKDLGIPKSTVQRRRKRLEKEFLITTYSLNPDKFGWRNIILLIATERGATHDVGRELLKRNDVSYVASTVGEHMINLRAEAHVSDNAELLQLLEQVKAMNGVKDVMWIEVVETIGRHNVAKDLDP